MNSTLLISMLVVLPIVAIIIAVMLQVAARKKSDNENNELDRVYREIIATDNLEITDELVAYGKILALDAKKKVFVYIHTKNDPVYSIIRLEGLLGCLLEQTGPGAMAIGKDMPGTDLHGREIHLAFLSGDSVLVNLPLYSEAADGVHTYTPLAKIATDWQQKLNRVIHN